MTKNVTPNLLPQTHSARTHKHIHQMNIQNATQTLLPHPYSADSNGLNHKSLIRRASSSFKHNASFVARLPTIRRHKSQSLHSPGNPKPPSGGSGRTGRCPRVTDINASSENLGKCKMVTTPPPLFFSYLVPEPSKPQKFFTRRPPFALLLHLNVCHPIYYCAPI